MGNILPLTVHKPSKLGFKRAQKRSKRDPEGHGQMNLFQPRSAGAARILSLPSNATPFEAALGLDERGDLEAAAAYKKAISIGDCVADAYCNLGALKAKTEKKPMKKATGKKKAAAQQPAKTKKRKAA